MQDILVQIIFGWPAILLSMLLAICGLVFKKWAPLAIGGLLALPFSVVYMGGYFNSYFIGALLTLGHFGAAFSVYKERTGIAWALMAPFTGLIVLLFYAVLTQPLPP
jgi:lipoprotein signal peptidase